MQTGTVPQLHFGASGGEAATMPTSGNAELWNALQQQQHAESSSAPHMVPQLQGYALPPGALQPQHAQQPVLASKPLEFAGQPGQMGAGAGSGITGLPSSLTSLPGIGYGSAPQLPPGSMPQHPLPQLYGAPPLMPAPASCAAGSFPQLSGLSSQLSSGMVLTGGGAGTQQLVPSSHAMQLSAPSVMINSGGPGSGVGQGMPSHLPFPMPMPISTQPAGLKLEVEEYVHPSSSHSAAAAIQLPLPDSPASDGGEDGDGSPTDCMGSGGLNKSRYRGVSYDRKKAKWRVQIKVAALGKSGVSVGYFDTEEAAARAYDRAAIGLLGRDNPNLQTNFDARDYTGETIPPLTGKTREEVKTTLKSERIKQAPRRRFTSRQRTSRFMGVGSSNRKNQWQARILVHGKVTHLGYYETEEEAARVYDKVSLALHGNSAQTNFPASNYTAAEVAAYSGLDRENLQRALGVKPMDKSSKYRGVSKKKGKWEAKVMVNRRWAYRELFDSEEEAARAYDRALWRLKPKEAHSYVNFKDDIPPEVAHLLATGEAGIGEAGGRSGGRSGAQRATGSRHRSSALGSSEEEEEEPSDGSEALSDEEGSGGTPAWTARGTSRSGRRLRGPAAAVAAAAAAAGSPGRGGPASAPAVPMLSGQPGGMGRVASAPNLLGSNLAVPPAAGTAAAAAGPAPSLGSGFVAVPGGGLQLQFGTDSGGAGMGDAGAAGLMPMPIPASVPMVMPAGGGAPSLTQPLMVRVGSETHLIPHQQQQQHAAANGRGGAPKGLPQSSSLGKRMNRIQSEPNFAFKDELGGGSELPDLMNDRDLFKAFDLTVEETGAVGAARTPPPPGMGAPPTPPLDLDLDTSELLDFIKEMPDVGPPGGAAAAGRGGAGMFKSRSMGNLMDLSAPFFDEDDEALAAMEYARPRKMSKSMSVGQLAGMDAAAADAAAGAGGGGGQGSGGRPPLPPGQGAADKLGPLGKPIRRTNTFSSSLAVLEEADREGRAADDHAMHAPLLAPGPAGLSSHHSSGDDLVQRLLAGPAAPADHHGLDDPMQALAADDFLT
ncbi:hypothetical protein ABPG77_007616 [Micractinium sp. CCAP 211/92]